MLNQQIYSEETLTEKQPPQEGIQEQRAKINALLSSAGMRLGPKYAEGGYNFEKVKLPGGNNLLFVTPDDPGEWLSKRRYSILISPQYDFIADHADHVPSILETYLNCVKRDIPSDLDLEAKEKEDILHNANTLLSRLNTYKEIFSKH